MGNENFMIENNYSLNNDKIKLYLNSSNNALKRPSFKTSSDKVELSNKNTNTEEKKPFLSKYGIDIAAFTTGIVGIGVAIKTGKINKKLKEIAYVDKLTGLFNRRYLDDYLKKVFNAAKKDGSDLHVFMFDIDKFKTVNTALGHDGGDDILKFSSAAITKVVDKYKAEGTELLFARYGGEEFTLVVQGAPKEKAMKIAEEIRASVNKNENLKKHADNFVEFYRNESNKLKAKGNLTPEETHDLKEYDFLHTHVDTNKGFTISGGLCSVKEYNKILATPYEAVKFADIVLERAKNTGRNQLCTAGAEDIPAYAKYKIKDAAERRKSVPQEEMEIFNAANLEDLANLRLHSSIK